MIALDLFAGHGWGVACQRLGIEEYGVEIMPEARAIREANGMVTLYHDAWEGLEIPADIFDAYENTGPAFMWEGITVLTDYDLLIASPPCQTFSMAGGGAGRRALDDVLAAIDDRLYMDPMKLREFGEKHDPRTALVLTPLAHVARDTPTYVVLEQVPPVLPVWERCAEEMRRWGYSVWVGILNAEEYGVPQTRRRAVLIARADGIEAAPPKPTHNRYDHRAPDHGRNADPTLLPWVSMAEALGWDNEERVGFARRADDKGAATADGYRERDLRPAADPAQHLTEKARSWSRYQSNQTTSTTGKRYERDADLPAPTITAGSRSARRFAGAGATAVDTAGQLPRHLDEPAHTITGTGSAAWVHDRPATTVAGDSRIWPPGHKVNAADRARRADADERYGDRAGTHAERVTVAEAAALQSYPPDFEWDVEVVTPMAPGLVTRKPIGRTKQFLTIGNAVPPLLAEAILKGFTHAH